LSLLSQTLTLAFLIKTAETEQDGADEDGNGLGRYTPTNEELAASRHETNLKVPLYNVWKQQTKTNTVSHFGVRYPYFLGRTTTLIDRLL
jgi:hypothetical protein